MSETFIESLLRHQVAVPCVLNFELVLSSASRMTLLSHLLTVP
jgi:hypothetical protein